MKQIFLFFTIILAIQARAQTGVLMNRYYISGSLSLGQNNRDFANDVAWLQLGKDTTNKGVFLPRVILDSITTSKRALFVYDLKDSVLYHFDGNKRVRYLTYKDTSFIRQITVQNLTTDNIPEGVTNKYYTDTRARNAINAGTGISYTPATGNISNAGVLSVDGSNGNINLANTYHKQGGNNFGRTDSIGTRDNFGINFLVNNGTRFNLSNTGKGTFSGNTVEDILTLSNDKANKLIFGVGRGGQFASDNFPFILFGANSATDPVISGSNFGNNRLEITRVDHIQLTGPTLTTTPELRGAMQTNLAGTVLGIGARANGIGGGLTGTSGILNWLVVPWHYATNSDIMPSSGNMEINIINIVPRVNQTGTATGTVRGILINPNLIAAPDFRAIVIANNSGYGIFQSGTAAKNYFNGNTGIKITNPTEALEVGGNIKTAQPSANGAGAIKIGKIISGATVTVQTDKYLEIEIDGVIRKLAIVN